MRWAVIGRGGTSAWGTAGPPVVGDGYCPLDYGAVERCPPGGGQTVSGGPPPPTRSRRSVSGSPLPWHDLGRSVRIIPIFATRHPTTVRAARLCSNPSPPHSHHRLKISAAAVAELLLAAAAVQTARDIFQKRLLAITLDQLLRRNLRHVPATSAAKRQPPESAEVSEPSNFLQRNHHKR